MHLHEGGCVLEHVSDERDDVESCESLCISFIVLDQSSTPCGPGKGPFDHPAPGQQDKAALCLCQLHDMQSDALFGGGFGDLLAGVSLINVRIPIDVGHLFRCDVGHHSDLKPAGILISFRPRG